LARIPDTSTLSMPMSPARATRRFVSALCAIATVVWLVAAVSAAGQAAGPPAQPAVAAESLPPAGTQPPAEHPPAAAAEGEGGHESPWALPARLFNFALLAGSLFYLLRSPLMRYLAQRGIQVRSDLTNAASLRKEASAELAAVEAKVRALPGEIEALKRRGAEEIAAEEARVAASAEAERRRLLDQAKREIEMQLRVAERDLKTRAAELAVEVATSRVKRTITATDHERLVNQYVSQVRH
jgi:F-type H+-transporting ATPase subunit b